MNRTGSRTEWWVYTAPYLAVILGLHVIGNAWIAALLYHASILLYLRNRQTRSCALFSGWRPGIGVPLILVCAASGLLLYGLWPFVELENGDLRATLAGLGLGGVGLWIFCLYFSTVGVVLEELFWRCPPGGGPLRDAAFAAYHAPVLILFVQPVWVVAIVLILFAMGWIWRIIATRTRGLAIPVVSHAVADLSVVVALFLLLRP